VGLKLGFLSTARINEAVLAGLRKSDRIEAVAVASRDRARAEAYALEHGFPRAYGSYEELLADPEVEAVYISVPNSLHVEWSLRALEAGKHVLCEKPLTRHPEDAARAFDAAERAGLVLMEAFMFRFHPQTKRLAELVADGAIGELRLVRSAFSFRLERQGDVRLSAELEGGALMDVGCYCVNASRLLAGQPVQARGEQTLGGDGVDVRFAATMRHDRGVLAVFDCGMDIPGRAEIEAVGSEGVLRVPDPWLIGSPGLQLRRGDEIEEISIEPLDRYQLQLENFADAIRGVAEPLLGRDDAVGQARTLQALYESAERGGRYGS
jgi:D-xylose 1-dehydrogenase (NADP+, D-xylono-1,5-lactone-forming)